MKKLVTYKIFIKSIVFLLLIGQIWTNSISYVTWMISSDTELIELSKTENNESEEEDTEEKSEKLLMDFYSPNPWLSSLIVNASNSNNFFSVHPPKITTPPPQSIIISA